MERKIERSSAGDPRVVPNAWAVVGTEAGIPHACISTPEVTTMADKPGKSAKSVQGTRTEKNLMAWPRLR